MNELENAKLREQLAAANHEACSQMVFTNMYKQRAEAAEAKLKAASEQTAFGYWHQGQTDERQTAEFLPSSFGAYAHAR